jgi:outer membrane protein
MKKTFVNTIVSIVAVTICLGQWQTAIAQQKTWSLKDCVDQALRENVALNQNITNNERINYTQSKANQLPNLNLTDQQSVNYGRSINTSGTQTGSQFYSSNNFALTSSITIYNGLKDINLIKENKMNVEAGNLDVTKAKNDLTLNLVAAYMQVLFEYEAVNIAQTQIDVTTEHLKYTEKYVKAGSLPESNLIQMQAQLATDNAAKVAVETQLQIAKVILMQLIELPVTDSFDIERPALGDISPEIPKRPEEIYQVAERILPDVKSAVTKTSSAEIGLRVARSEILPKITLTGSLGTDYSSANSLVSYHSTTGVTNIGYLGSNPSELVYGPATTTTSSISNYPMFRQFGDNFGPGISLNINVPIFNNLLFKSDIERSKVIVKVAKLNESAAKKQLRKSIEQAYTDLVASAKNYTAISQQLIAEERSYHDITLKFKAGLINITDFFVEKNNFSKAQLALLQARYQYVFKSKLVAFYTGNPVTQ